MPQNNLLEQLNQQYLFKRGQYVSKFFNKLNMWTFEQGFKDGNCNFYFPRKFVGPEATLYMSGNL